MSGTPRAADLPEGSVVSARWTEWIKDRPGRVEPWSGSNGGTYSDGHIDRIIADGIAEVLRIGAEWVGDRSDA